VPEPDSIDRSALIGIATCTGGWASDEDAPLLCDALRRSGASPVAAIWDDPAVDWSQFALVVVRSTWDYHRRRTEFVRWARQVESATRLFNPADVIAWNTDKRYLAELAADGIPIVSTRFLEPGDGDDATSVVAELIERWTDVVVKPAVSAGSWDTSRFDTATADAAVRHAEALLAAGRTTMVQPYVSDIDTAGETGLVYFDGTFSHAFRKDPLLPDAGAASVDGLFSPESVSRRAPSEPELAIGAAVLGSVRRRFGQDLLYARVDLVPGPDGRPQLLELELTEPSFFLVTEPTAADRAAASIVDRL